MKEFQVELLLEKMEMLLHRPISKLHPQHLHLYSVQWMQQLSSSARCLQQLQQPTSFTSLP